MRQLQRQRSLALIVGCTHAKTLTASQELLARNLTTDVDRCRLWVEQVQRASDRRTLRGLYKGQQWLASLELERVAAGYYASVNLWVFSAGLGLRRVEESGPGYGASFTDGPDTVGPTLDTRRAWWAELRALVSGASIADVRATTDEMLVVLAPAYLAILEPELDAATDEGVAVVSSTAMRHRRGLNSGGLQKALGGSDQTLNQRAAGRLINFAAAAPIGSESVLDAYRAWAEPLRAARSYDRTPLDDQALRTIISTRTLDEPLSASRLLRELRRDGFACEQKRFHRLYAETKAGVA